MSFRVSPPHQADRRERDEKIAQASEADEKRALHVVSFSLRWAALEAGLKMPIKILPAVVSRKGKNVI
jgi:hypothetical protein